MVGAMIRFINVEMWKLQMYTDRDASAEFEQPTKFHVCFWSPIYDYSILQ